MGYCARQSRVIERSGGLPCVGAEDYSRAPLTEPDVRASHPALWIDLSEWQQQLP
jgi:hypothetical protein